MEPDTDENSTQAHIEAPREHRGSDRLKPKPHQSGQLELAGCRVAEALVANAQLGERAIAVLALSACVGRTAATNSAKAEVER
jgi:hypothetical protein